MYEKEPTLEWTKVMCPVCSSPTGPSSECYKMPPAFKLPDYQKHMRTNMGIMPIFSQSCTFRQENLWQAELNYPVSQLLIDELLSVEGIDKLVPVKPYMFQVAIAKCFDERQVKQGILERFVTFVKSLRVDELAVTQPQFTSEILTGVQFPNGETFTIGVDANSLLEQSDIIRSIMDIIPDTSGIFSKSLDLGQSEIYNKE